jgi:uncharacterized protein YraI
MIFARSSRRRSAIGVAVAIAAWVVAMLLPVPAQAARPNGYPVTNVNLRAGPGTDYPVIVTVPGRAPIAILGCLADYTWCDVVFQNARGWMRSIYLQGFYQGYYYGLRDYAPRLGYPVVAFDINAYWNSNYRERPFYADRARWGARRGEGWTNPAIFYSQLAPYGNWVWLQGQYVWVPDNVGSYWRPYTVGRWLYTDSFGWMWASNEPFGWATYHYGRWGFSNRVGWFWVPGSRWAPAWVSWRASNDYLAWAPLPPAYDEHVSIDSASRDVPDYYWQVVPTQSFLAEDLPRSIVRDKERLKPALQETRPLGNVTVNNNVVVNNAVNPQYVEEKTKEKVVVHKVQATKDAAKAGKVEGAAVEVFRPAANQAPASVAPPTPKKIEDVAAASKTKEQAGGQPATDELLVPPEIKTPAATQAAPAAPPLPEAPKPGEAAPAESAAPPPPPPPPAEAGAPPLPGETSPETPPREAGPPPPPPAEPPAAKGGEPIAPEQTVPAEPPIPPAGEALPPPPASGEAAPPGAAPPPPAVEEEVTPKAKEGGHKGKKGEGNGNGEGAAPQEAPAIAPEAPPEVPLPPPAGAEAPKAKKEGKPKKHEEAQPEEAPAMEPPAPPPPIENAAPPPPPPPRRSTCAEEGEQAEEARGGSARTGSRYGTSCATPAAVSRSGPAARTASRTGTAGSRGWRRGAEKG